MTAIADRIVLNGMAEAEYHAHPALSSTGARKLLSTTPAHFRYWADHPTPRKRAFDLGHATHKKVLGVGADLVYIDAADYRTKAAQQERDAAYDAGKVPLLPAEVAQVDAMVAAVRANRYAAALFDPDRGRPEQSLFWVDDETGAPLRARLDWLPNVHKGRRMVIPDLKTCRSASRGHLSKAIYDYGYFIQAPYYMAAVRALGLAEDVTFVFVFVESEPPHLTVVRQIDADALRAGQDSMRRAVELFADCLTTDTWPGYGDGIEEISLPYYAARQLEETS